MNRQIVGLRQVLASGKLSSLAGGEFVPRFEAAFAQPAVFTSETQMDQLTRSPREFRKPPFQPRTPLNAYAEVRSPATASRWSLRRPGRGVYCSGNLTSSTETEATPCDGYRRCRALWP
jgi:hypothetical protein